MRKIYTLLVLVLLCCKAHGQVFSAPVGIATIVSPGVYNLTPAAMCGGGHKGAVWCTTTIDFSVSFVLTYQASFDQAVPPGADGIAVVFGQNITPTSINFTDAYLGYYNVIGGPPDPDFNNSFGVEFDIFDNSYNPYFDDIPGTDHTAICLNAVPTTPIMGPVATSPSTTNIKDGAFHDYKITWCPLTHTLQVFYNDTLRMSSVYNYATVFTTPTAVHWGFSGGTGAACSNQIIKNISLVTGTICAPPPPCLVNSLIINTGYDPVAAAAVPPVPNLGVAIPGHTDPLWKVTDMSAATIAGIAAAGGTAVAIGANADVVQTYAGGWAVYSGAPPQVGNWIHCLNANYYNTNPGVYGPDDYTETFSRSFHLCSADSVLIDIHIACDNYCVGIWIDGNPPYYFQPSPGVPGCVTTFLGAPVSMALSSGYHTINVKVCNYNNVSAFNYGGLGIWGTVSSLTGTSSIISEVDTTCSCAPVIIACDTLSLPDSLHLCKNATVTMPATLSGADPVLSILWTPSTGLSSTSILNPTLTAITSGWYDLTVQSIISSNLVMNGDFSAGNIGFTSAYTFVSGPGSLVPAGVYAISTDPHNEHPGAASFHDHTTGTGNMLAINGASTPINVWCQTITVTPNTWYDFSAWFANWSADTSTNLPIIQFEINGILVGSTFSFPHPDGLWTEFFTTWYSGASTTANICINDQQTAAVGNDFAIDDISFRQLCISKDSIYVALTIPDTILKSMDTSICVTEGTITLTAPAGNNWLWSTGSVAQSISVNVSGIYWVKIVGGCDSLQSDTFHVSINPVPVVTLRTDTTICAGDKIILGSPEPQGIKYLWSTGSTDSSIEITSTGTYTLTVSENECTASGSMHLGLIDKPAPINLGPDTALCKGEEIILTSNANNTVWSTAQYGQSITVVASGTYWASVSNQCGSAIDTINVDIEPCDIWFPNAFTPNDDGLNDIARVTGNLKFYKNFSLSIYNRWGQRVFYTEDIYSGWNGEFNGVKQGLGTYFYMICYSLQGKNHFMKGDLELIR